MSIGSILKPNDPVEIAVLPRGSAVAYREGIKLSFFLSLFFLFFFYFFRRQQVHGEEERSE